MTQKSMYLYGKNSVAERLKSNPGSIRRIFIQHNFNSENMIDTAKTSGIPIKKVSEKEMKRIKKADRLQGIVAEVDKFAYVPFDKMLRPPSGEQLSLIFLDNLNDPHNLGAIIRSLACIGGFGAVIPAHGSCEVNDTVMHVASGGENFVPVSMVTNMTTALMKAKEAGYWAVGTVVDGSEDLDDTDLPFPICLVMGSEGKGIRHGISKHLDVKVRLSMKGAPLSFNVGVACAIFCYEIGRKSNKKG